MLIATKDIPAEHVHAGRTRISADHRLATIHAGAFTVDRRDGVPGSDAVIRTSPPPASAAADVAARRKGYTSEHRRLGNGGWALLPSMQAGSPAWRQ